MSAWLKLLLAAVVVAAICLGIAVMIGGGRWRGDTEGLILQLRSESSDAEAPYSIDMLAGLPAPVVRYFRTTLTPGQPMVRTARLRQSGEFRTRLDDDSWSRFDALQYATASPPGFVWDARIRMAPLLDIRVRDVYRQGAGGMLGSLGSIFTVLDTETSPELSSGALQRFLAESVWLPTALLPGRGVRWTALDDSSATATLRDHDVEVSLEFRFNAAGDVIGVYTPARYREQDGEFVPTPWVGTFAAHDTRGGMRVPLTGEVAWVMPEGEQPYWRGRIDRIDYELAR
jgi:hypothetical protein